MSIYIQGLNLSNRYYPTWFWCHHRTIPDHYMINGDIIKTWWVTRLMKIRSGWDNFEFNFSLVWANLAHWSMLGDALKLRHLVGGLEHVLLFSFFSNMKIGWGRLPVKSVFLRGKIRTSSHHLPIIFPKKYMDTGHYIHFIYLYIHYIYIYPLSLIPYVYFTKLWKNTIFNRQILLNHPSMATMSRSEAAQLVAFATLHRCLLNEQQAASFPWWFVICFWRIV